MTGEHVLDRHRLARTLTLRVRVAVLPPLRFHLDDGPVATDDDDIPEVLEPLGGPIRPPGTSESTEVWEGTVDLALPGGVSASGEGKMRWACLHERELRLAVRTHERPGAQPTFDVEAVTSPEARFASPKTVRLSHGANGVERVLLLADAIIGKTQETVDSLLLQLLNAPRFLGLPVRQHSQTWAGRVESKRLNGGYASTRIREARAR